MANKQFKNRNVKVSNWQMTATRGSLSQQTTGNRQFLMHSFIILAVTLLSRPTNGTFSPATIQNSSIM